MVSRLWRKRRSTFPRTAEFARLNVGADRLPDATILRLRHLLKQRELAEHTLHTLIWKSGGAVLRRRAAGGISTRWNASHATAATRVSHSHRAYARLRGNKMTERIADWRALNAFKPMSKRREAGRSLAWEEENGITQISR